MNELSKIIEFERDEPWERIMVALVSGCSEEEFQSMLCPRCNSNLVLTVHPNGKTFFVRCTSSNSHLAMHGRCPKPPEWFLSKKGGGWY